MTLAAYRVHAGLDPKPEKKPKYKNEFTFVDGQRFDSKKEAARFNELQILERAGVVSDLKTQESFTFPINGEDLKHISGRRVTYIADFTYTFDGKRVVEDVKSPITAANPVYKLKKALMLAVHGIEIVET